MIIILFILLFVGTPNISMASSCDKESLENFCVKNGGTCSGGYCKDLPLPKIDWASIESDNETECKKTGGRWTTENSYDFNFCDVAREMSRRITANMKTGCKCKPTGKTFKTKRCWVAEKKSEPASEKPKGTCIDAPTWHEGFKEPI